MTRDDYTVGSTIRPIERSVTVLLSEFLANRFSIADDGERNRTSDHRILWIEPIVRPQIKGRCPTPVSGSIELHYTTVACNQASTIFRRPTRDITRPFNRRVGSRLGRRDWSGRDCPLGGRGRSGRAAEDRQFTETGHRTGGPAGLARGRRRVASRVSMRTRASDWPRSVRRPRILTKLHTFAYLQGIADRLSGHRDAARENLRDRDPS